MRRAEGNGFPSLAKGASLRLAVLFVDAPFHKVTPFSLQTSTAHLDRVMHIFKSVCHWSFDRGVSLSSAAIFINAERQYPRR